MACSITDEELKKVLAMFDLAFLNTLNPDDFIGFGFFNPDVYRRMFVSTTKGMKPEAQTMVVELATIEKNRTKIFQYINQLKGCSYLDEVKTYFSQKTVQSTRQAGPRRMPVVNIPSCEPSVAAWAWRKHTPMHKKTVTNFLQNVWAAYIAIDKDLLKEQEAWERNFWNNRGKFNKDYYKAKSQETWPLLQDPMSKESEYPKTGEYYTREELLAYLTS